MKKIYLLLFFLFFGVVSRTYSQTITTEKGLTTAVFALKEGTITVYLPDDIRPGEAISGTVLAQPNGNNAKQASRNLAELKKYSVEFDGQKFPVPDANNHVQYNINNSKLLQRSLSVVNSNGINAGQAAIPTPLGTGVQPSASGCGIPSHALTAEPLRITGPFDGNSSNTNCSVGNQPAEVLVESMRQCIIRFPANSSGVQTIQVKENNVQGCTRSISGVDMQVSTGKLNLLKGQQTYIDVQISGLQGLQDMALLTLQNTTAQTVTMQPSNNVIIPLNPDSVSNGKFNRRFGVQSINTGSFSVNVNLDLPEPVKDFYTDIPKTDNENKTDTVPCKDLEEKVKAAAEALEKLKTELAGIDNLISNTQKSLDDCNKVLEGLLKTYHAKKKVFDDMDKKRKNWERSGKSLNEEDQKKFDKAKEEKEAASKDWSDQKRKCNALEAELAALKARKAALPGLIATGEGELKGATEALEKCKTKAAEDKKKKEEEDRKGTGAGAGTGTQPEPAGGNINPGTGADKEGSPCNPEGLELVEPQKRVYGSCFVKETEITPCNTNRISNEVLELVKKAFEKFKKLSGPLEIAEKVASCASAAKAICVNVHLVRNWEDVELTYVCVKGKWVLKNRKVTGRGEDDYGWYIVKDKEIGNTCCWVFGKKEDGENAMEAHLKEAIQEILDQCK